MNKEDIKKLKDEWDKCASDPTYFISRYIKVVHPVRGIVPFKLYPFQKHIVGCIQDNRFNILRKFRQAGCTTVSAAYALWMCTFQEHKTVVFLSVGDTESTEILDRVRVMHEELPEFLREKAEGNMHNMKFANGSVIKSRPSGKQSGRSLSGSLLFIDEAAFIENIDTIWAAVYPIISTGGRAFVLSTVNGVGNWYHEMWLKALNGESDFHPIDIAKEDHPEYYRNPDYEWLYTEMEKKGIFIDDWERSTRANMPHKKWLQEYCCEFLGTGDTYIEGSILSNLDQRTVKPKYRTYNNRMYVWEDPIPGAEYIIATDPSLGRERDNAAFVILNAYTGNLAAEFYSNTTPLNELAEILNVQGMRYNTAVICPERNNIGHVLIDHLFERLEYENMWFDDKNQIGEQVTQKSRDTILAEMEEALRMEKVKINSKRLVSELNTFIVRDSGKAEADKNQHDDLVMSLALAVYLRNKRYGNNPIDFASTQQEWREDEKEKIKKQTIYRPITDVNGNTVDVEDVSWLLNN